MRIVAPLFLSLALLAFSGPAPAGAQVGPPPNPKISPALLNRMAANATAKLPVILEMTPPVAPFSAGANVQRAQAALNLLGIYGQAVGGLALINAAAGIADSAGIQALASAPGVAYVHEDATVIGKRSGNGSPPPWPPGHLESLYPQITRAQDVWPSGQGAGVTVAVLDSGIAASADFGSRLLAHVNFADQLAGPTDDPGGHGTHVAGIVAASGVVTAGEYVGIAPAARLVDVRVLDSQGRGRLSSMIRGIEWVLGHRTQYGIRVLNLSLGGPAPATYLGDPLSAAVEIAWRRGLVVVAAAGNAGPGSGTVGTPGVDPLVVTVGATDDLGSLGVSDDVLGWFSSWNMPSASGGAKPDLVAPGRKLVSERVPGSAIDQLYPDRVTVAGNGATMTRLTGTSQATPVVAGTAALMLAHMPGLKPDQVKAILTGTAVVYGGVGALPHPAADGAGLLDAMGAYQSGLRGSANAGWRPSDGLARALYPALYGQPLVWKDPLYQGIPWNTLGWANIAWDNIAWDNIAWDNIAWDNIAWDNIAWDQTAWDNIAWDNIAWDNIAWDNVAWD